MAKYLTNLLLQSTTLSRFAVKNPLELQMFQCCFVATSLHRPFAFLQFFGQILRRPVLPLSLRSLCAGLLIFVPKS